MRAGNRLGRSSVLLSWLFLSSLAVTAPPGPIPSPDPGHATAATPPQAFELNQGQADPGTRFISRADGLLFRLDKAGIDLDLGAISPDGSSHARLVFTGASSEAVMTGFEPLPGTVSYFAGSDPGGWIRDVPTFAAVRYQGLYPDVELTVRGDHRRLTLSFSLRRGSDPDIVGVSFEGDSVDGSVRLHRSGGPREVTYTIDRLPDSPDRAAGLSAPNGARTADEIARVVVDRDSNTYVAGRSLTTAEAGVAAGAEAFVARIDRDGRGPAWTAWFGGAGRDVPLGLAVAPDGSVVVAGRTESADFPLVRPLASRLSGAADAFATRISSDGRALLASTYLGGGGEDEARAVALDAGGNAWVAGTGSPSAGTGSGAAMLAVLSPEGDRRARPSADSAAAQVVSIDAIAFDAAGRLHAAGTSPRGLVLLRLAGDGSWVVAPTPIPVTDADRATDLAVDATGTTYLVGRRMSEGPDTPERGFAAVAQASASTDPLVTLLDRLPLAVAASPGGHAFIAGEEVRAASAGSFARPTAFIARLSNLDAAVDGIKPIAGTAMARATGLALDSDGRPIVAGIDRADADGPARLFAAAAGGGLVAVRPVPEGSITPAASGCPGTIRFDNSAGTGLWQTATNWNTDVLPGAADDVCIPAGMAAVLSTGTASIGSLFVESGGSLAQNVTTTLTIASASQVDGTLTLTGGTLTGNFDLVVNGTFNWNGGAMSGAGTTDAGAGMAIGTAGTKDLTSSRVLNTHGTVTWTGTGAIRLGSGGTIHNLGTWDARSDATITNSLGGTTLFDNPTGSTFKKTLGSGVTTVDVPWSGDGAVSIESGTVSFTAGGSTNGSFTGTSGVTLRFGGGAFTLGSASTVNVPNASVTTGSLTVNGAWTTTVSGSNSIGSTWTFNSAANLAAIGPALTVGGTLVLNSGETVDVTTLTLSGGSRQGTDTLSVSGTFAWSAGSLNGAATTNANGPLAFSGANVKDVIGGHVLNTKGATTWTGTGTIRFGGGSIIHNTAAWEAQNDTQINNTLVGGGSFDNQVGGSFTKKTGTGTTALNCPITNAGSISAETGTISFGAGGSGTGSYTGLTGTTLQFNGGTFTLDATATLNAPNVIVAVGTVSILGSFTASSSTTLTSGTLTFEPSATLAGLGALSVSGGTLDLRSGETVNLPTLTVSGGATQGTDLINVAGLFAWSGGSLGGAATTNANGPLAFSGVLVKDLIGGRILNTKGATTWTGTGTIRFGGGSIIHNTAAWEAQNDTQINNTLVGGGSFDNQVGGSFTKKTGTGTTALNCPITNAGSISAETGTISFGAGGSGAGSYTGLTGTTLQFNGGTFTLDAAATLNAPNVVVAVGTVSILGSFTASSSTTLTSGTLTFEPSATLAGLGALSVSGGTLDLRSGETVNLPTLTVSGGATQGTDLINVAGLFAWSAGSIGGAATLNANGGMAVSSVFAKDLLDGRTLNTFGTVTWSGTGGLRTRASSIRNAGTWQAQSDAQMSDSLGAGGTFDNLAGATFQKTAGTGNTSFSLPLLNHGTIEIQSGAIEASKGGSSAIATSITGSAGTTFRCDGGLFSLDSGSTFQVPNVDVALAGTLEVRGSFQAASSTTVGNSGTLTLFPEATVTSLGTALAVTGGTLDARSGETLDLSTLTLNVGTIKGSDTLNVSGALTWSAGTMTESGIVNANGGGTLSGVQVKDLTGGRVLNTAGTVTWTGTGLIRLAGGAAIHNSGTWSAQGDSQISVLSGTGLFDNTATGTFQRAVGTGTLQILADFTNAGSVRAQSGTLQFSTSYTQTAGSLSLEGGAVLASVPLAIQGGSLTGSGTVTGNVNMNGHLAPGLSPGSLTITGSLTDTAASAFDVEIGGLTPATEHDRVVLSSAPAIAGTLNVTLVNGYVPVDLDTFTILTFPSATGTFATVNTPPLGGDLVWQIFYNQTTVVLKVIADLDGDGVRNLSDCAPLDPTAWSVPAEVSGVQFATNNQTVSWTSLATQAGPATIYDLMRGLISQLPVGGKPAETCLAPDSGSTSFVDATTPAAGTGFYYLVRGSNVCGVGTYGTTSGGAPRNTTACP